jgi:hypothetical protein
MFGRPRGGGLTRLRRLPFAVSEKLGEEGNQEMNFRN